MLYIQNVIHKFHSFFHRASPAHPLPNLEISCRIQEYRNIFRIEKQPGCIFLSIFIHGMYITVYLAKMQERISAPAFYKLSPKMDLVA